MNQKITCPYCFTFFKVPSELSNTMVCCPSCSVQFKPTDGEKELKEFVGKTNQKVTHAEFVAGIPNSTIGFGCLTGDMSQFLRGPRRAVFNILVFFYMAAPSIVIPLWAWHEHNWCLLGGIAVSAIPSFTAHLVYNPSTQRLIGILVLIGAIDSWLCFGIHNYCTFIALSALWGIVLFMIADAVQFQFATRSLMENRELFEDAVAHNTILIVRKDDVKA